MVEQNNSAPAPPNNTKQCCSEAAARDSNLPAQYSDTDYESINKKSIPSSIHILIGALVCGCLFFWFADDIYLQSIDNLKMTNMCMHR